MFISEQCVKIACWGSPQTPKPKKSGDDKMQKNRRRKQQIHVYFSEEEMEIINAKMQIIGTENLSAYVRKMTVDGEIKVVDSEQLKRMNQLLFSISNNINQIAKRVNTTNSLYAEDLKTLNEKMEEIWRLQVSLLSQKR